MLQFLRVNQATGVSGKRNVKAEAPNGSKVTFTGYMLSFITSTVLITGLRGPAFATDTADAMQARARIKRIFFIVFVFKLLKGCTTKIISL